jgi:hypothetical protein
MALATVWSTPEDRQVEHRQGQHIVAQQRSV